MPDPPRASKLELAFDDVDSVRNACAAFCETFNALRNTIAKVVIGQEDVVEQTLMALFADGHVLLEGVPGLGKTLLVRTLGQALSLPYARIQFTPDLMPADITGTNMVIEDPTTGHRVFTFKSGPIFHQLILADEINRATPKSQAALLEAMQERSVTVAGTTYKLDRPFLVMATQNPIDQEGTYPLPEAQLDRFLFKIAVPFTTRDELNRILTETTSIRAHETTPMLDADTILRAQRLAMRVIVAPHVQDYAIRLVLATHRGGAHAARDVIRYIGVGVSPRGAQALISAAKVRALINGRYAVSFGDLAAVAPPALRHRILLSFEAEADRITTDQVIEQLLNVVPHELDDHAVLSNHSNHSNHAHTESHEKSATLTMDQIPNRTP
jgi:MoxR-like ATPase